MYSDVCWLEAATVAAAVLPLPLRPPLVLVITRVSVLGLLKALVLALVTALALALFYTLALALALCPCPCPCPCAGASTSERNPLQNSCCRRPCIPAPSAPSTLTTHRPWDFHSIRETTTAFQLLESRQSNEIDGDHAR